MGGVVLPGAQEVRAEQEVLYGASHEVVAGARCPANTVYVAEGEAGGQAGGAEASVRKGGVEVCFGNRAGYTECSCQCAIQGALEGCE